MRYLGLAVLMCVLGLSGAQAEAQSAKAGVVTAVQGQSAAIRGTQPRPVLLKLKDDVFVQDRIETRENSVARILLSGKALVTIRELSVFTITEEPGRAVVGLQAGKLGLGVAKSLLKPGEAVEVRTPNAIAAVRGSAIVVEVGEVDGEVQTLIAALHVSVPVTVAFTANPQALTALTSNHFVVVSRLGPGSTSTPVRPIPPDLAARLSKIVQAPTTPASAKLPDQVVDALVEEAGQVASAFGQDQGFPGPASPSTAGIGVQENPCRVVVAACAPAPPPAGRRAAVRIIAATAGVHAASVAAPGVPVGDRGAAPRRAASPAATSEPTGRGGAAASPGSAACGASTAAACRTTPSAPAGSPAAASQQRVPAAWPGWGATELARQPDAGPRRSPAGPAATSSAERLRLHAPRARWEQAELTWQSDARTRRISAGAEEVKRTPDRSAHRVSRAFRRAS